MIITNNKGDLTMRQKISNSIIGIIFVVLGIGFMGQIFDWWNFSIFFHGWWTLFIIIPCVVNLISCGFNVGNLIGIGIGVVLLLACQDVFDFSMAWKIIVPFFFVLIGLSIVFKSFFPKHKQIPDFSSGENGPRHNATAIFGGSEPDYREAEFEGVKTTAIFGGVDLNLKTSKIEKDCQIDATCIFGGIDIIMPPYVKVKLLNTSVLGGVDNKFVSSQDPDAPTVTINATCIFGGIDIK